MSSDDSPLFSRDEVLGGVSARRARALLFLIEYWAARLAFQDRKQSADIAASVNLASYAPLVMDDSLFQNDDNVQNDPDDGYYRAFGLSREELPPVTVRQIEEHAAEWAHLVPDNARLRAQTARLLLQKYPVTERGSARLRAALGIDTAQVQAQYSRLYREALRNLYVAPTAGGWGARLRGIFGGGGGS